MEKITDIVSLNNQIAILERQLENDKAEIAQEFTDMFESLRPVNLIKGLLRSVRASPDLKADLMHGAIGLGTGFLTNKLLLGRVHGPLKAILGAVLPAMLTRAAVQYPETIKEKGASFLVKMLRGMKLKDNEDVANDQHGKAGAIL